MRRLALLCLIVILFPALLWAGPIYGTIFLNGSVLRGATVSIACPGGAPVSGPTLDDGSYRIAVPRQGRCTVTVTSPAFPGAPIADVVSVPNAAEYNFMVVKGNGGSYELHRR
jgi:hypothetical protein